ncbi:MAG: cytochrome c, partial [Verrucomicrobiota bacterium]
MDRILLLAILILLPAAAQAEEKREFNMSDYLQGRYVYERQCVTCHGRAGRGDGPWAEGLLDQPRNFRLGVFKFRTTPIGFLPTDDDLRRTIRSGVSGTAMPAFKKLSDRDVNALIVYIQGLSRRWDNNDHYTDPIEIPDPPKWMHR